MIVNVAHAEQIRVGDISVKYNIQGEGDPIVLINGFGNHLESWNSSFIEKLKEKHTVITFDNRGVGNTTSGSKPFTIKQFAKDTDLFLDKINVTKTHVMGFSMGGKIAQELALFSDKIDKLIISSTNCGQQITPAFKKVREALEASPSEIKAELREVIYPKNWNLVTSNSSEVVSSKTIGLQQEAIAKWKGTCDKLKNIEQETLITVGKKDNFTPPPNAVLMAKNIKGSWLIQLDGMHPIATQKGLAESILFFMEMGK